MNLKVQVIKEISLSFYNFWGITMNLSMKCCKNLGKIASLPTLIFKKTLWMQLHVKHPKPSSRILTMGFFNISWWVTWYLSERANGSCSSLCEQKKNYYRAVSWYCTCSKYHRFVTKICYWMFYFVNIIWVYQNYVGKVMTGLIICKVISMVSKL